MGYLIYLIYLIHLLYLGIRFGTTTVYVVKPVWRDPFWYHYSGSGGTCARGICFGTTTVYVVRLVSEESSQQHPKK